MSYFDSGHSGQIFSGVYFCNPGEYKITLDLNFSMHSSTAQVNAWGGCGGTKTFTYVPQWPQASHQIQSYSQPQFQFQGQVPAPTRLPHCDSGSSLYHYPESSSGMEESYASGFSSKGIPSNSWCFNAPNQNPYENIYGNQTTQLVGSPSPKAGSSKQGCFPSKKNCNII